MTYALDYRAVEPRYGDSELSFLIMMFAFLAFLLIIFAIHIGICTWVYRNAKKNKIDSPVVWFLLCFILPFPFGLIIYIVVRSNKRTNVSNGTICASCGAVVEGHNFCPSCGVNQITPCPNCKTQVKSAWNNCPECGVKLK